jgi:asparagine synthase (glutamine-hydrolysing)
VTAAFVGVVGRAVDGALPGTPGVEPGGRIEAGWAALLWWGGAATAGEPTVISTGRASAGGPGEPAGPFARAQVDRPRRELLLTVDRLGAGGLFWCGDDLGRTWFATELGLLVAALPRRPAPDEVAIARRLTDGLVPQGRTLYEGIARLRGGTSLRLAEGMREVLVRWRPRYTEPGTGDLDESAAALAEAASAAVGRRTVGVPPDRLGILLSGGLDSAAVGAFLPGGGPQAFTASFPEHQELDERALATETARQLDLPLTVLAVRGASAVASSLDFLDHWQVPSASPNLFFQQPLLDLARNAGIDILFDGQGGDELFGHAAFLPADRLRRGSIRGALALARRFPGAGADPSARVVADVLLRFGLRGAAPRWSNGLPSRAPGPAGAWLLPRTQRLQKRTSERWAWKRLDGPLWWRALADGMTAQRERMEAHDYLRRKEAMTGVAGAHPFLDDADLVEAVLALPPEHAFDPVLDRAVLRHALRGRVPEDVRLRRGKAWFDPLFVSALSNADREVIAAVVGAPDAELRAYVDPEIVRTRLLEASGRAQGGAWAWALWRLFTTECWLQRERDQGFVERIRARFSFAEAAFEEG